MCAAQFIPRSGSFMNWDNRDLVTFVQSKFSELADPVKAGPMQAYMKTTMPFYGIQKPDRIPVYKEMKCHFAPANKAQYESAVRALWALAHREEKYTAIEYARQHKSFITADSIPLYKELIQSGAWWDIVDDVAINLVGDVYLARRSELRPLINSWIDDADIWIRRTALISHNHHRASTDAEQLFDHCLRRAHEKEFFIRKAIGWALREYSYANPDGVRNFLLSNRGQLSLLSFKEGGKRLAKAGLL